MVKLLGKILGLQLALALCACAALEVKPERVDLAPDIKHFTFIEKAPSGRILTDNDIINLIVKQITEGSGIKALQRYYAGSGNMYNVRGVEVKRDNDTVKLTYINGDYHANTQSTYKTDITAEYKIQIRNEAGKKHVAVNTPTLVSVIPGKSVILLPIKPLLPTEQVVADILKINSAIKPEFKDTLKQGGEFNVKYNDESVYANFTRLLGSYEYRTEEVKKFDIEKGKIFRINDKDTIFPVKVAVYPYRNGSKVLYEIMIPYIIQNNGTTTFDESKIETYSALIKKVAND